MIVNHEGEIMSLEYDMCLMKEKEMKNYLNRKRFNLKPFKNVYIFIIRAPNLVFFFTLRTNKLATFPRGL